MVILEGLAQRVFVDNLRLVDSAFLAGYDLNGDLIHLATHDIEMV